jgi:hypothetical protein
MILELNTTYVILEERSDVQTHIRLIAGLSGYKEKSRS